MHDQQITDFEKLKRMTTDAALGVNTEIPPEMLENKIDGGKHHDHYIQCSKDYITLCKEQSRIDQTVNKINSVLTELIKVNLQRENTTFNTSLDAPREPNQFMLYSQNSAEPGVILPDSFRDFNSSEESKPVKNNKMVKLELGGGVGTPPTAAVLPKDLLPARA